jgi:hypothetical protein
MREHTLWSIGSPDGRSPDLIDTYKQPTLLGDVAWRVPSDGQPTQQRWPLFHPSEADPDAGYRLHPYTIEFSLAEAPREAHLLRIHYLAIAPRLAHLEIVVNGVSGFAYLRPRPSQSGEIRLQSGLHTTIYAEGILELIVPAALLRAGENRLTLISRDGGETLLVDRIEAIRRLDRMASGAGFIYQALSFARLANAPADLVKVEIAPSVIYHADAGGALAERCQIYIELGRAVAATALTLTLHDRQREDRVSIAIPATQFGHIQATFDLFDGDGPVEYSLQGIINGAAFNQTGVLSRRRKWKVYLTPHAHTDIGYTHRQWEVAERLCRNIDAALDMLENDQPLVEHREQLPAARQSASSIQHPPAFAYHLDSSWALETYLATRGKRGRRRLIEQVRAGRVGIPSMYVDLLTQYAGLEDLIRNNEFSESFLRPAGLAADFASIVDVASLSGALPTLLAGAGVRYLVHANNQDRGPFRLNGGLHRLSPFYWQGAGGGRVLVWLSKMYCELRKVCGSPPVLSSAERGLELWLDEYERADYAPDAVMLYGQEADNTDIDPQPAGFVRRWNATYAYPRLIACDVSEFFNYVESGFGEQLKTVKGDGGAYWEDGVGSTIAPAIDVRRAQALLPAAERLEALAAIHNPDWAFPLRHYDDAWRSVLLFDEHTWGAFLSGPDPDALLQHDQWAVKLHMARDSIAWAERLMHAAATRHSLSWNNDGREVVVYNPHSWPCSGPVTVEIGRRERAFDATSGAEIPARRLRALNTQAIVELWVDQLEGLSYRRFVLREVEENDALAPDIEQRTADQESSSQETLLASRSSLLDPGAAGHTLVELENADYRLVVNLQRGCVTSWFDKALGRELADSRDEWGFGQLVYARGGEGTRLLSNQADLPDGDPALSGQFQLIDYSIERFSFGTCLRIRGAVACGDLEIAWTLQNRVKRVDVAYTYHKQERLAKEAAYIAFPLDLAGAAVWSDSQLGWVNWDQDQLPGGCKEWLPLQTGVLASGPGADVLIASPDIPLFCVGDVVRGRWPKQLRLSGGRLFSYVLNNYWHTNYKASQGGPITFGYQLTSDRAIAKDQAFRAGWAARRPLYAQRMSFQDFRPVQPPYQSPAGGTLARINPEQAALSTIKPARWAGGYIVRLQEISGSAQRAAIAFPERPIARAWATDLLERDERELAVEGDGTLRVDVPAWGLATVRVVFGQAER